MQHANVTRAWVASVEGGGSEKSERGEGVFVAGCGGWREAPADPPRRHDMAQAIQIISLNVGRDIPFNKRVLSQQIDRSAKAGVSLEELADDIAHRGVLTSLNVRRELDAQGRQTGIYRIPAGGRRYRALPLRVEALRDRADERPTEIEPIATDEGAVNDDSTVEAIDVVLPAFLTDGPRADERSSLLPRMKAATPTPPDRPSPDH